MTSAHSDNPTPGSSALAAVARLIQFRSELAILVVLAGGVLLGALARQVLPVSIGPSAGIAAPPHGLGSPQGNPDRPTPRPARKTVAPQTLRPQ
jgi:hypothetical protein